MALAMTLVVAVAWRARPQVSRIASLIPPPDARPTRCYSRLPAQPRGLSETIVNTLLPARARRRNTRRLTHAFPDFIDLLVLTVRAGCTPLQAFDALAVSVDAPLRGALHAVVRRVAHGERFADAVAEFPSQLGAIAQPLADALALCDRYGTPLAPILDRLADEARAQRRRNADAAARQLPIRLSFPLVGLTLPSFVLLTIVPLMAGAISSLQGFRR